MAKFADVQADVSCDPNYVPSAIELVESEFGNRLDWNFSRARFVMIKSFDINEKYIQ